MNKEVFREILRMWRSVFFTDALAIVCQCAALVAGIQYYRKRKEGLYFIIFAIAWLLAFTVSIYITKYIRVVLKDPELSILVEETSNVIVTITEYTCFSYFFYHSLHQIKNKKLVIFFSAFFILPVIIFFVRLLSGFPAQSIRHLSFTISSIEMILLLMPGLLYFIELFYYKPVEHLSQKPSFWIVSALTLYCILVIPFFLIADRFIYPNSAVLITGFTIHLISFCLLFLALVKAFSLNKKLTE